MRKLQEMKDLKLINKIMKTEINGFISKSNWCILPSIRIIKQSNPVLYQGGLFGDVIKEYPYYDLVLSFLCFSLWISFINKEIK